jgi:hypothetical protein
MSPRPRANAADGRASSIASARLERLAIIRLPRQALIGWNI